MQETPIPEQEATSEMSITQTTRAFKVSTTNREITATAGAVLIRETASAVLLGRSMEQHLHIKKRARGLSEAEFVSSISEAVAAGATCLDDLAVARADSVQEELRGFEVPAPQTAGSFLRRFTPPHVRQFDKAMREVHLRAFSLLGIKAGDRVTLDFDSTYIRSRSSRRQGADRTYLKRYALHPLFCHVAEHGTVLHAKLRRGKTHTANGIDPFVDECLKRVPEGAKVRARFDSGFYSSEMLGMLEAKEITYLCGVWLTPKVLEAVGQIPDREWSACAEDKDEGEVAEFRMNIGRDPKLRRFVAKRIEKNAGEQLDLESGKYQYWVLVTNDHRSAPKTLEQEHRHKAQVEGAVRELKENFGLEVLRKHGFMANWAWILIVAIALNLIRWTQLMGDLSQEGDLRAKRFRYRYLSVPALLTSSGSQLTLKLRADYPLLRRFLSALRRLRRLTARRT